MKMNKRIQAPPPCPQDFLKIMQFSGNFKGKTRFEQIWAQG